MNAKIAMRLGAALLVALFAIGSWITSGALNLEPLKYVSGAVFVGAALYTFWDLWLWRFPWLQLIPGVPLCVRGTWKGTLESSWIDMGGEKVSPKDAYLVVRQTYSLVHVTLLTNESKSESSLSEVLKTEGLSVLHYLFFNKPKMKHETVSRMHHGSTTLGDFRQASSTPEWTILDRQRDPR